MDLQTFLYRTGRTQTQLAQEIGVSVVTVNEWSRGNSTPKHPYCRELLLLGMQLEELFDEETAEAVRKSLGCAPFTAYVDSELIVREGLARILARA